MSKAPPLIRPASKISPASLTIPPGAGRVTDGADVTEKRTLARLIKGPTIGAAVFPLGRAHPRGRCTFLHGVGLHTPTLR